MSETKKIISSADLGDLLGYGRSGEQLIRLRKNGYIKPYVDPRGRAQGYPLETVAKVFCAQRIMEETGFHRWRSFGNIMDCTSEDRQKFLSTPEWQNIVDRAKEMGIVL